MGEGQAARAAPATRAGTFWSETRGPIAWIVKEAEMRASTQLAFAPPPPPPFFKIPSRPSAYGIIIPTFGVDLFSSSIPL